MKTNCTRGIAVPAIAVSALLVTGCASMPQVTVGYYEPKASLGFTVTQTATCTTGDAPVLVNEVTPNLSYTSNTKKEHKVDISKLGSRSGKADAGFEFYPDGRLKGLNVKGTGQAGEALKAFVKLAPALGLVKYDASKVKAACEQLRKAAGDGKTLTIIHRGTTDFDAGTVVFRQMSVADSVYTDLQPIFGTLGASYEITKPKPAHEGKINANDGQELTLIEPAIATVTVVIVRGNDQAEWPSAVLVPQHGTTYKLPIQKAPWFGTNEFELQVHDSGKVTKLRYAGGGDAAGVFGVFTDAQAMLKGDSISAADQAKAVQAEADLIYQQQRLVLCQANPANCPK